MGGKKKVFRKEDPYQRMRERKMRKWMEDEDEDETIVLDDNG